MHKLPVCYIEVNDIKLFNKEIRANKDRDTHRNIQS